MPEAYAGQLMRAFDDWASREEPTADRCRGLLADDAVTANGDLCCMLMFYLATGERGSGAWARLSEDVYLAV